MFGIVALVAGGLSLAIIAIMVISFISVISGFIAGGISYLITGNAEASKGWILLTTLVVVILLIVWIV